MKQTKFSIYGAMIGDYYGSYWEFLTEKPKSLKDALKLRSHHFYTDDTFMTCAIAKATLTNEGYFFHRVEKCMREIGNSHWGSYGGSFAAWLSSKCPLPYNSLGNGAAMRVSPCGLAAKTLDKAYSLAYDATAVTHDHPYGLLYGTLTAELVYVARRANDKAEVEAFLKQRYPDVYAYVKSMDLKTLHREYAFNELSQTTVPQAIFCVLDSDSFADCLAKSLYIGGDSDTLSAISCSIAAPLYGDEQVKPFLKEMPKLPDDLADIVDMFQKEYLC